MDRHAAAPRQCWHAIVLARATTGGEWHMRLHQHCWLASPRWACSPPRRRSAGATLDNVKEQGLRPVRRQRLGPARVRRGRRQQQLVGPRHRPVPCRGRGPVRRRDQGQVHAAERQGALHRAAVGRDRRAVAQHDLDQLARQRARPEFPGVNYYDGQGFMAQEVAGRGQRARSSTALPSACRPAPPPS